MPSAASSPGDGTGTVLDHIAVAVERWTDAWPRYVHQLGGTWHSGGVNTGFSPAQLRYANGTKVEILQPWEPEANPFLRRFLDHSGPGPHHLTFKVPDIEDALERAERVGFEPVGVQLSDPHWKEGFLHPRQATGVVVQLAQADYDWSSPAPEGFPPTRPRASRASLLHVTHAVRDLDSTLGLFHELLGGAVTGRARAPGGTWESVDVAWAGPLTLRLVAPTSGAGPTTPLRTWLGDRPGRVHHLAFALPGPGPAVDDFPARDDGGTATTDTELPGVTAWPVQVVAPDDNFGTGLVLQTVGDAEMP
jgi:catechol 2,3-dioxygenase-like lactoylglutathione lyase family enzyme